MTEYKPLTEATFFIMLSLSSKPLHGYAIMQQVAAMSDGRIQFSTSTLYGALKRLLEQGWIERVASDEPDTGAGLPRKDYCLSPLGRQMLMAENNRLQALATLAKTRLATGDLT